MMTSYQIVYWRDIPAQVRLRHARERSARPLHPRFQEAIDAAAMLAHATSADAYLEDWRTDDWQDKDEDPHRLGDRMVAEIEAAYPVDRLQALVRNSGFDK